VLEDFGVFIDPPLMNMYGHLIPAEWKTLDEIEKTEETVHHVVRVQTPGAKPPVLHAIRRSEDEVVLILRFFPQTVRVCNRHRQRCGKAVQ
jgi:hypothetical protein